MSKIFVGILASAAMVVGLFAAPSAVACGTDYLVAVEVDTGQGVSYCSDGTLEPFLPADGDGASYCGGKYNVTVETDTFPEPAPGYWYCSDGTFQGVEELIP